MAETDIAVVGMACRLPGARNLDEFWSMLREGRDARVELTDDHLRSVGVPAEVLGDPDFVKAAMLLGDIDKFDAGFFGMSPRDAALFDPQHRVFLECCWEAFEHAGHVPDRFDGRIGVFAGCGMDTYLLHNILTNPDLVRRVGMFLIRHTGNDKDFLATRVSYQFDLRGPSVNVVTACSTSLVAVHEAAQSLLAGECEMALAGGVTILVPQDRGYHFKEGEVLSPDGHCRAFDADARGTIFGSGAGVVALRRLADALESGDTIHAILAGSAVNNDGARKVSYLAPSVDGYAEVVAEALALADVPADRVQYVESHGTGTSVGDPIEIEALTQAFRVTTDKTGYCGIGSVKTNIGHLDTAAGVAGMLKTVLAMQRGELPASRNYKRPNPLIDFGRSPFQVVGERRDWPRPTGGERIAGVSSLGVGGTNVHVVLKESLEQPAPGPAYPRRCHLLPVSGKVEGAALDNGKALAGHLRTVAAADLPDVGWTLQRGRRAFAVRGFAVGASADELAARLEADDFKGRLHKAPDRKQSLVFLFPGGGAQYPGMARGLYEHEPVFREHADKCLQALPQPLSGELRSVLFGDLAVPGSSERMERGTMLLPSLFVVEYALARTLMSLGIEPDAMLGHSLGEYVAATLCGTFTVEQVMKVLLLRGQLLEEAQGGAVLTVSMPPDEVHALCDGELSLAAANAPQLSAVAGTVAAIERAERVLQERGIEYQRLRIGVAAHSHMLDPVLDKYRDGLRGLQLAAPKKPWISNVTGDWIDPQRVVQPDYWVEHLRRTVRFQDGVATLLAGGDCVFVEVGPGKTLTSLVRLHEKAKKSFGVVTLPHPKEDRPADAFMLEAVGRLWQLGIEVDWDRFHGGPRRRVPLPTYAFQRQRHWIEPGALVRHEGVLRGDDEPVPPSRLPEGDWLRQPVFHAQELPASASFAAEAGWLCVGGGEFAAAFARAVQATGGAVARFVPGTTEGRDGPSWQLPFGDAAAWGRALEALGGAMRMPQRILFALPLDEGDGGALAEALLAMWQALGRADLAATTRCLAVTRGAVRVAAEAMDRPGQGVVAGFLRVVPREYAGARVRAVDLDLRSGDDAAVIDSLRREIEADDAPQQVARRSGARYVLEFAEVQADASPTPAGAALPWRQGGVYLITGGLGGIGMLVADRLAERAKAKLVLVSRRGLPPRAQWDRWLELRSDSWQARAMRQVRRLEERGAEVEVMAADVSDLAAVQRVVAATRARFSALHGIVHAAGVLDDGLIQMRTRDRVQRMLAPKLRGAIALDAATADQEFDAFVLFASTSGFSGIPGQCDYAAANSALDAFATWRSGARRGRTLAVDWGVWQDVGMLAGGEATRARAVPAWFGERRERAGDVEFTRTWSPATDWQLAEHRIHGGNFVMPGTGHLELMVTAARAVYDRAEITLGEVEFLSPLQFRDGDRLQVFVSCRRRGDAVAVRVQSAPVGSDDVHARTTHARAVARSGAAIADACDLAAWGAAAPAASPAGTDQARLVDFGPRWQCIERVTVGKDVALGQLRLPSAFAADLAAHALHPAMLDMAFGCGIRLLSTHIPGALFVPVGCEEVRVAGSVPGVVVSHVAVRSCDAHSRLCVLDVTLASPDGIGLAELRGLQLFGVHGTFAASAEHAGEGRPDRADAPAHPAPPAPEPRIRAILSRGITGPEGMAALERALQSGLPQVVVSSMDPARVAHWLSLPPQKPAAPAVPAGSGGAPAAAGAADDPRDEVEQKLAASYHDLLGVDRTGLDQDFFELGGHSLLAVRLFARIHKDFGLDLELSTLLLAGTVRKLGAVVRELLGLPEPGSEPVRSVAAKKGFHVVPIQTEGTRPKLFLVHGAGGNVLGFRELSHYFGKDQPVYGLQARGVDGKQQPLETIDEMAAAYLAELREVQPHGPYFFGGYSGGGLVAYEMAQQLLQVGERVAFLGMIDTPNPQMRQRSKVARGLIHVGNLLRKGPMYPLRILRMKLDRRASAKRNEVARQSGGVMPQALRGEDVQFAFERAFYRHVVKAYPGHVDLFRAQQWIGGTRYIVDEALGWRPFVQGGMTIVECPGDHFTMCTEPNVQVLCRGYMAAMDRVLAGLHTSDR